MRIRFYGSSDDNVCFSITDPKGKVTHDEWGCYQSGDDKEIHLVARVTTIGGSKGCLVRAIYDGCWSFAVGMLEEGRTLPVWQFRLGQEHEYSVALEIDAGEELLEVVRLKKDRKHNWVPVVDGEDD
jgi:hypothetical protein